MDRITDLSDFNRKISFVLQLFYEQSIKSNPMCQDVGALINKYTKDKYRIEVTFESTFKVESDNFLK